MSGGEETRKAIYAGEQLWRWVLWQLSLSLSLGAPGPDFLCTHFSPGWGKMHSRSMSGCSAGVPPPLQRCHREVAGSLQAAMGELLLCLAKSFLRTTVGSCKIFRSHKSQEASLWKALPSRKGIPKKECYIIDEFVPPLCPFTVKMGRERGGWDRDHLWAKPLSGQTLYHPSISHRFAQLPVATLASCNVEFWRREGGSQGWIKQMVFLIKLGMNEYTVNQVVTRYSEKWLCPRGSGRHSLCVVWRVTGLPTETNKKDVQNSQVAEAPSPSGLLPLSLHFPVPPLSGDNCL